MQKLEQQIETMERIDQLIRLKSTGSPKHLAARLGISEATVFRIIDTMKKMNAPICYNLERQSYIYTETTHFRCGFYTEALDKKEKRNLTGGHDFGNATVLFEF